MHIVAQREMAAEHGGATDHTALTHGGGTRNSDTGRHRSMIADAAIMADHDLIIELDTIT